MKIESEEFPYCQLNETIFLSPDNKVLSKSLMINLRNEKPEIVYKNYLKLKQLIDNKEEDKPGKKAESNPGNGKKQTKKEEKKNNPDLCPKCNASLVEKQGISSKNGRPYHFFSCSTWPICDFTKPFISEVQKNAPCDEAQIALENVF